MQQTTNAERFIHAYNVIDKALRTIYCFKPTLSYSEIVRRCSERNSVVRKYEDELLDYGRLRNSIVHRSEPNKVIAEPHIEVVEEFEKIAAAIATPPLASSVAKHARCVSASDGLKEAVLLMSERGYSNVPVVSGGRIDGVLKSKDIVNFIGAHIDEVSLALESVTVADALTSGTQYYACMPDCPINEVLDVFDRNRKCRVVLITERGTPDSKLIGIITLGDLAEINRIMEKF